MKFPVIETGSLFLRRPDAGDRAEALAQFREPWVLASLPLRARHAAAQIVTCLGQWEAQGHGLFAVVPQGADGAVGLVGPWHPHGWPEPELGWLVWGGGPRIETIAAEAAAAARDFAQSRLGWRDPVTYVGLADAASAALARSLGAVLDPMADLPSEIDARVFRHPPAARRRMDQVA